MGDHMYGDTADFQSPGERVVILDAPWISAALSLRCWMSSERWRRLSCEQSERDPCHAETDANDAARRLNSSRPLNMYLALRQSSVSQLTALVIIEMTKKCHCILVATATTPPSTSVPQPSMRRNARFTQRCLPGYVSAAIKRWN